MRRGITVDGQLEAITTTCEWLDAWRQDCAAGPWWPEWITMADLRTGRPSQSCPARPSWCYGTPGIARAGQLAGIATGDAHRQQRYEEALVRCLDDPAQQARITNNGLCHGWAGVYQLYIQFSDWSDAEQAAADHLAPLLRHAEEDGVVTAWWFMRKHPCWRLRLQPGPAGRTMKAGLDAAFDELAADGRIGSWSPGIYEAETAAFGGDAGMDLAPELFCADSRAVLDLLRNGGSGLGRRELSLLLCSILMRAAGLEWYEQGDVWHRVARERRLPADVPTSKLTAMADDLMQLMLADVTPDGPLGLPARTQSILAWAARAAILDLPVPPASAQPADRRVPDTATTGSSGRSSRGRLRPGDG